VVLSADGLPASIRLDAAWRRLVGAEGLAAAVTEAGRNAVEAQWDVGDVEVAEQADAVAALLAGEGARPPAPPADQPLHYPPSLAEDVMQAWDATTSLRDRIDLGEDAGSAALGRLTLTFSPSDALVCEADVEWVGQQDTDVLAAALGSALASLRAARETSEAVFAVAQSAATRLALGAPAHDEGAGDHGGPAPHPTSGRNR
jgi:hypothetical protein